MHREIICLWQIAFGAQSEQALQRVRGWGDEVGVPTLLFHFIEMNAIRLRDKTRNNKKLLMERIEKSYMD
ncbi:hypothetical protein [Anaerostipes sp.]|uniref:hypothetical protein n=1 Tax=Anaerostipes sp. TaxID=1872530 RepID=UPI0025BD83DF|nr:hypothetical protein [Anaerostipes sp.]MBS7009337.1 hypothetical protein [Anaerostipes sp.]